MRVPGNLKIFLGLIVMSVVLSLSSLCKSYGSVTVADDQSFDVSHGQAIGIIGPNGAGKTSLFNLLTGVQKPDSGTIRYFGRDITADNSADRCKAGIARSFQIPQPFAAMSVFENTLVGATQGAKLSGREAEYAALESLERTGLIDRANVVAGKLTLLEGKRLELARALSVKPKLLLLDEIAGGLTENECKSLIATIRDIKKTDVTIIWIEHIVHALLAVVDKLVVIDYGKIIASGDPEKTIALRHVREIYMGLESHA
jgi:branched-chain amino acid transport system ATP-binding protein